jgi:hypothetical protein
VTVCDPRHVWHDRCVQPLPRPEAASGPIVGRGGGPAFAATPTEPDDVPDVGVPDVGVPDVGVPDVGVPDAQPTGGAPSEPDRPALVLGRPVAAVAAATAVVMGALLASAAFAGTLPYAIVTFVAQLALVAAWCLVTRPPGVLGAVVIGVLTAIAADGVALGTGNGSIGPLVAVLAGAFGATTLAQLARGVSRRNVTESFGATLTIGVAVVALASTLTLRRTDDADLVSVIVLAAAGGILLARLVDLLLPRPAAHPDVPRGVPGLVLGSLLGAGVGALCAVVGADVSTGAATLVGLLVGTAAVLADLGVDYARAGRLAAGTVPTGGLAGAALGPLIALAVAAPIGYLVGLAN